jgi:hypothetical protein
MSHETMSCGAELAASAEVPDAVAALFTHVAINLRAHANWVGSTSADAAAEQAAMTQVAAAYEALGAAAERAASLMRTFTSLAPVDHPAAAFDRNAFVAWMRSKIGLQRRLAAMIEHHADRSEHALKELDP